MEVVRGLALRGALASLPPFAGTVLPGNRPLAPVGCGLVGRGVGPRLPRFPMAGLSLNQLTKVAPLIAELKFPWGCKTQSLCFVNLSDRSVLLFRYYYRQHSPQIHLATCCPGGKNCGVGLRGLGPGPYLLWPK